MRNSPPIPTFDEMLAELVETRLLIEARSALAADPLDILFGDDAFDADGDIALVA